MTIEKVLNEVKLNVPSSLDDTTLIRWLSRCESQLKTEIFDNYVDEVEFNGYDDTTPKDTVLLVGSPYDEIYVRYLEAMIYRYLGEMTKYNNCITEYNALYDKFHAQYTRDHVHKGPNRMTYYGGVV